MRDVNKSGTAFSIVATPADDMRLFDELPGDLRCVLAQAAFPWSSTWVSHCLEIGFRVEVLRKILAGADISEVQRFASKDWPAKFGPYPAVAAQATILYNPA